MLGWRPSMPENAGNSALPIDNSAYDEVEYPGRPYVQTHPGVLATCGHLLRLSPAAPERCRVLEFGCGDGANLLGMAAALPDSTFVGVDLAASAIRAGTELARESGLTNVSLHHGDLTALDPGLGEFDYVVAHGVYSWVPAPVRDALLAAFGRHLGPAGIGFVSYATYPGAHLREIVREMMQYHSREGGEPLQRVAQGIDFVRFVRNTQGASAYGSMLADELKRIAERDPSYVFHDDFAPCHEPVYFRQFAAHAAAHGLAFATETSLGLLPNAGLPGAAHKSLEIYSQGDPIAREQYLDFTRGTAFRQSLLCRATATPQADEHEERMLSLFVYSDLQAQSPKPDIASRKKERFVTLQGQNAETDEPLIKAIFATLARARPRALQISDLLAQAEALAGLAPAQGEARAARIRPVAGMLLGAAAGRLLTIVASPPRHAVAPSERPSASALVRAQARRGSLVTTLRHDGIRIEPRLRALVRLADGTRTLDELRTTLAQPKSDGKPEVPNELFQPALGQAIELALMAR
jgi:SAM-dependent methyltransferase